VTVGRPCTARRAVMMRDGSNRQRGGCQASPGQSPLLSPLRTLDLGRLLCALHDSQSMSYKGDVCFCSVSLRACVYFCSVSLRECVYFSSVSIAPTSHTSSIVYFRKYLFCESCLVRGKATFFCARASVWFLKAQQGLFCAVDILRKYTSFERLASVKLFVLCIIIQYHHFSIIV
jgi:hypothetical protein